MCAHPILSLTSLELRLRERVDQPAGASEAAAYIDGNRTDSHAR